MKTGRCNGWNDATDARSDDVDAETRGVSDLDTQLWVDLTYFAHSLKVGQCKFLIALYCLCALQPSPAAVAISEASHQCLLRKHMTFSTYHDSDQEYYLRAFWCCSVLEGEVVINLKSRKPGIAEDLNLKTDWPSLVDDQQSMFFLAETQSRQIQTNIDSDFCAGSQLHDRRLFIQVHQHQLPNWHSILPKELIFSIDQADNLFEDRKCFLRMQYHCTQTLVTWPSVFTVLAADTAEVQELLHDRERCGDKF
jgi:hypothetical protein